MLINNFYKTNLLGGILVVLLIGLIAYTKLTTNGPKTKQPLSLYEVNMTSNPVGKASPVYDIGKPTNVEHRISMNYNK